MNGIETKTRYEKTRRTQDHGDAAQKRGHYKDWTDEIAHEHKLKIEEQLAGQEMREAEAEVYGINLHIDEPDAEAYDPDD